MKRLWSYVLLAVTVFFVVLGASMPRLAARAQDAKLSEVQETMALRAVNLTLRQEGTVGTVLRLMAGECTARPWDGETVMTQEEVRDAVWAVFETLIDYDLLTPEALEMQMGAEEDAAPTLLVGTDGSSALIWTYQWSGGFAVTVDDATGQAVQIMIANWRPDGSRVTGEEDAHAQIVKWTVFLQDYYDMKLTDGTENFAALETDSTAYATLTFSAEDDMTYDLNLIIGEYCFFNF